MKQEAKGTPVVITNEFKGCPVNQKYCAGDKCQWWDKDAKDCSVPAASKRMRQISNQLLQRGDRR